VSVHPCAGHRGRSGQSCERYSRLGWNSSTGLPDGSSTRICEPPGPVTMSLRKWTPPRGVMDLVARVLYAGWATCLLVLASTL